MDRQVIRDRLVLVYSSTPVHNISVANVQCHGYAFGTRIGVFERPSLEMDVNCEQVSHTKVCEVTRSAWTVDGFDSRSSVANR